MATVVWSMVVFVAVRVDYRGSEGRGWFAFQQHYAVRAVNAGEAKDLNPWLDYATLIHRDFPGADSLASAWRVNPRAMARHVGENIGQAPLEVVRLGKPHGALDWLAGFLFVAGTSWLVGARPRARSGAASSTVLAWTAVLVVAPGMIVLAKNAYLLPLVPLVVGGLGWWTTRVPIGGGWWRRGWRGVGLAAAALAAGAFFTAPQPFQPGTRGRPVREAVQALETIWPKEGRPTLLAVGGSSLAHYLGDDRCVGVEAVDAVTGSGKTEDFAVLVRRTQPLAVLITPEWRSSRAYDAEEIERALPPAVWQRRDLATGPLYWRRGGRAE